MILAILQARMSSSRLPGKVLKTICGKPILSYEINRIKRSKKIDKLVLATSLNSEDDILEHLAKENDIDCFRGDLHDVLKRFYDCALTYNADTIVRLTGDCPIIEPCVIDDAITLYQVEKADYASNSIERTYPDGLDVEVFSLQALIDAHTNATKVDEREHVTKYIYDNSNFFKIAHLKNDIDYSYIRWTLDTIDDFYFFKHFYEAHQNLDFNWKEILSMTNSAHKYLIESNQILRYAMKKLEEIINDETESLYVINGKTILGTIASSDIRRSLIYGDITNNDQVVKIANKKFHYLEENKCYSDEELLSLVRFKCLPVLNNKFELIEFKKIKDLMALPNKVVLMAGGLGSRLKDITLNTPKPMLKIGGKPILQTIIEQFSHYGFNNFYISVNHLADQIMDYFENGNRFDAKIQYLIENKKLGTVGCLSLINDEIAEPIFIMNGDILAHLDLKNMLNFHKENDFEITIASIEHQYTVPYGVIDIDENNTVVSINEKPTKSYKVSGGIYIINPNLLREIPQNEYYDITSLFEKLLREKRKIGVYTIADYWMDIGHPEDFYKAHSDYKNIFKEIK